jgi:chromosome segregation ATPase
MMIHFDNSLRQMARKLRVLMGLAAIAGALPSCTTYADPSVDSIFFSPARAERERIAPRRQALYATGSDTRRLRNDADDLGGQLHVAKGQLAHRDAELAEVKRQISRKQGELANLDYKIMQVQSGAAGDLRALKERRSILEDDLDALWERQDNILDGE